MELLIKKTALQAKIKSPDLLTRPVGRAVYNEAKKKFSLLNEHEVMVMDFEGISVMDSSFIDEFIISIMKDAINSELPFYIKLRNVSEVNQTNIESVINTYAKFKKERIALVINELTRDNTFIIGELSQTEHEVVSYLFLYKEADETELSQLLHVSYDELKKTIEKLHAIRVIRIYNNRISAV